MKELCNFCGQPANTDKGVIYVRAHIIHENLSRWINAPVCLRCFNSAQLPEQENG